MSVLSGLMAIAAVFIGVSVAAWEVQLITHAIKREFIWHKVKRFADVIRTEYPGIQIHRSVIELERSYKFKTCVPWSMIELDRDRISERLSFLLNTRVSLEAALKGYTLICIAKLPKEVLQ